MKAFKLILVVGIYLCIYSSCKKEEINGGNFFVVTESTDTIQGFVELGKVRLQYEGTIIGNGKINVSEHGFVVFSSDSTSSASPLRKRIALIRLGSRTNVGSFTGSSIVEKNRSIQVRAFALKKESTDTLFGPLLEKKY